MALPIANGKITTAYKKAGKMWSKGYHTGVDFAVPAGTPVYAVADGKIANANWGKAYGVAPVQDLGNGTFCIYAHLTSTSKKIGDAVKKGEQIGLSGNSGTNTTGAHLHFELRSGARWSTSQDLDPMPLLGS